MPSQYLSVICCFFVLYLPALESIQQTHPALKQKVSVNNLRPWKFSPTQCLPASVAIWLVLSLHSYMAPRANRIERCLSDAAKSHNGYHSHRSSVGNCFFRVNKSASLSHFYRHRPKARWFQTATQQIFSFSQMAGQTQMRGRQSSS